MNPNEFEQKCQLFKEKGNRVGRFEDVDRKKLSLLLCGLFSPLFDVELIGGQQAVEVEHPFDLDQVDPSFYSIAAHHLCPLTALETTSFTVHCYANGWSFENVPPNVKRFVYAKVCVYS